MIQPTGILEAFFSGNCPLHYLLSRDKGRIAFDEAFDGIDSGCADTVFLHP
jgi:hypothetical protein